MAKERAIPISMYCDLSKSKDNAAIDSTIDVLIRLYFLCLGKFIIYTVCLPMYKSNIPAIAIILNSNKFKSFNMACLIVFASKAKDIYTKS